MSLSTMSPLWAEPPSCATWLYLRSALFLKFYSKYIKSHLETLAKGYLFSIFHPSDSLEENLSQEIPSFISRTYQWHLEAGSDRACGQSFAGLREETERTELTGLSARVCWNCFSHHVQLEISATHLLTRLGFRCCWDFRETSSQSHSMLLQSGIAFGKNWKDKVRTPVMHPSLWVGCVFPFLWELAVARGTGRFISSQVWALLLLLHRGDSFEKGYAAMPTVSANLKREIRRVPLCITQNKNEHHSQTSITLTHPERVLIPQDARLQMMPCTMFGCPSAAPGRSVASANNLDRDVKRHRKFEQRQGQGSFGRLFNPSAGHIVLTQLGMQVNAEHYHRLPDEPWKTMLIQLVVVPSKN